MPVLSPFRAAALIATSSLLAVPAAAQEKEHIIPDTPLLSPADVASPSGRCAATALVRIINPEMTPESADTQLTRILADNAAGTPTLPSIRVRHDVNGSTTFAAVKLYDNGSYDYYSIGVQVDGTVSTRVQFNDRGYYPTPVNPQLGARGTLQPKIDRLTVSYTDCMRLALRP